MRPFERAACRHCGLRVGLFGVNGLGVARRWHEARCSSGAVVASHAMGAMGVEREARCTPIAAIACQATTAPEETAPPETATGRDLLLHVDRQVDMQNLPVEAMIQTLYMTREDLLELHALNLELCKEILNYVVVTWRPGAFSGALLRHSLMGLGPGRDDATVLSARTPSH